MYTELCKILKNMDPVKEYLLFHGSMNVVEIDF